MARDSLCRCAAVVEGGSQDLQRGYRIRDNCADTQNDPHNCGRCGNNCDAGSCVDGICNCPIDQFCGGKCVDIQNDRSNCGGCGNSCGAGSCVDGICNCPIDQLCGGKCLDIQNDRSNCGGCGNSCGAGSCVDGICNCPSDQLCGGKCVDIQNDPNNCGGCGKTCPGQCEGGKCQCKGACGAGGGGGDPHLRTFDGLKYDFQAVGEFTFALDRNDHFEVQIRTAPWRGRLDVSTIVGVAANVAGDRVSLFPDGQSFVNDTPTPLGNGIYPLPKGGELRVSSGSTIIAWPDGSSVTVYGRSFYLDVAVSLAPARVARLVGLLGNFDQSTADELISRDGVPLDATPTFATFYAGFAESWRIRQEDSLFTYRPGESTETFTDRTFPHSSATLASVPSAQAAAARATCTAAGITDPAWLDSCILDVGLTGETRFATSMTLPAPAATALDVQPRACAEPPGSKLTIGFSTTDPERVTNLQWTDSAGVLTSNLAASSGSGACQDANEFFGQSYAAPEFTSPGIVVAGHQASVTSCGDGTTITSAATDCSGFAQVPVTTTYLQFAGARASEVRIARTFGFDSTTPVFNHVGLRPYVPRLPAGNFAKVIYPNATNTGVASASVFSCPGDCFIGVGAAWSGKWFADISDSTGYAMIVLRDPAMTAPVQMTINNDGGSASNLTSFVLVQPTGGWKEPATEIEYLCFADLRSWPQAQRDAAQLPAGCGP